MRAEKERPAWSFLIVASVIVIDCVQLVTSPDPLSETSQSRSNVDPFDKYREMIAEYVKEREQDDIIHDFPPNKIESLDKETGFWKHSPARYKFYPILIFELACLYWSTKKHSTDDVNVLLGALYFQFLAWQIRHYLKVQEAEWLHRVLIAQEQNANKEELQKLYLGLPSTQKLLIVLDLYITYAPNETIFEMISELKDEPRLIEEQVKEAREIFQYFKDGRGPTISEMEMPPPEWQEKLRRLEEFMKTLFDGCYIPHLNSSDLDDIERAFEGTTVYENNIVETLQIIKDIDCKKDGK